MRPALRPPSSWLGLRVSRSHVTRSANINGRHYHHHVYALPFILEHDDAKAAFTRYATTKLANPALPYREFGRYLRKYEFGVFNPRNFAKEFFFHVTQMRAVYVPTWLVCASVSFYCQVVGKRDEVQRLFGSVNATFPGHGHKPMSSLWLSEPWEQDAQPRPFTTSMLTTKWGDPVTPMAYNVSPLRMLELWSKLDPSAGAFPGIGIHVSLGLRAEQLTQISFAPILRPVYIAEVHLPWRNQFETLVLPAWDDGFDFFSDDVSGPLYVYGPATQDRSPRDTLYTSRFHENGGRTGIDARMVHRKKAGESSDLELELQSRLQRLLEGVRQQVDWASIGGVDDKMWEHSKIVPYGSDEEWGERQRRSEKSITQRAAGG